VKERLLTARELPILRLTTGTTSSPRSAATAARSNSAAHRHGEVVEDEREITVYAPPAVARVAMPSPQIDLGEINGGASAS